MTPSHKCRKKWTEKIRFTVNRYTCHKCQTEHDCLTRCCPGATVSIASAPSCSVKFAVLSAKLRNLAVNNPSLADDLHALADIAWKESTYFAKATQGGI